MNPRSTEAYNSLSNGYTSNNELVIAKNGEFIHEMWWYLTVFKIKRPKEKYKTGTARANTDLLEEQVS